MAGELILLVDDEPDAVEFIQDLLEDNGYAVITAGTATDGAALIHERDPDLVCLDVLMPGESGISLYQKMRADPVMQKIPVIIISGMSFSRELKPLDCLTLPDGTHIPEPNAVVEKPVAIEQMMSAVRRLLK